MQAVHTARALIALFTLLILLAGGVVFGLPSIYPLLYQRGAWAGLCGDATACSGEQSWKSTKCCDSQMLRVTMVSSVAYFISDASSGPWGEAVARAGVHMMLALSTIMSCTGAIVLGVGLHVHAEWLITSGFCLLAVGGPGIFNSSYTAALEMINSDGGLSLSADERKGLGALLAVLAAASADGSALTLKLIRVFSNKDSGCALIAAIVWAILIAAVGLALALLLRVSLAPLHKTAGKHVPIEPGKPVSVESSVLLGSTQLSLWWTLLERTNLLLVISMATLNLTATFYMQTFADQAAPA